MAEAEIEYNEYGEVVEEVYERVKMPPFLHGMDRTPEDFMRVSRECVFNFYATMRPDKRGAYGQSVVDGTPYTAPLNKRQRVRLKEPTHD